tara:strand:+ start:4075 stop:4629 length:555 start_codon:yes stop_codon:yes gene_type:complete
MSWNKSFPSLAVLARPWYALLFIIITWLFFSFNLYIPNLSFLFNSIGQYSFSSYVGLLVSLFQGGLANLPQHSVIFLSIISILTGFVVVLITFKVRALNGVALTGTKTATLGALFGLAAPACAACGLGLLSLLGIGGAVAYLPFQGTEVAILSVALLAFAVFHLNKSMVSCDACQIDLKKFKKK